jgi:hypothetical protein
VITGCKPGNGSVVLENPAPPGGVTVLLSTSAGGASVPASLTFKAGVSKKTFKITTTPVASLQSGQVTAGVGSDSADSPLTIRPIGVASISLTPNPVVGGNDVTGQVTLECNAGPGDVFVSLTSSAPGVAAPTESGITIANGAKTGIFTVATTHGTAVKKATISATVVDALGKSKKLTVNP